MLTIQEEITAVAMPLYLSTAEILGEREYSSMESKENLLSQFRNTVSKT
jgi:hypothetical protein